MRGLYKLFLCFIFFISFLAFYSSAQTTTCVDSDDIIFKISANTNAHGQIWSETGYPQEICYSDLFDGQVYTSLNPHDCLPGNSNLVLKLSSDTNAHAQISGISNPIYQTNVCYGDLSCYDTRNNCDNGAVEVVSLSTSTNAHIETKDANYYPIKICCTRSATSGNPRILSASWRYYDGSEVPTNRDICPNIYLIARATTEGINNEGQINFRIYDDDLFGEDTILNLVGNVNDNEAKVILNSADPATRILLQAAFDELNENKLDLLFEASIPQGQSQPIKSQEIHYTEDENLCSYPKPVVRVNAPTHRGVYFKGTTVNFESGCTSQIGPLQYDWTITQGDNTYRSTLETFPLTLGQDFGNSGQANVKLKCTDLRGNSGIAENEILIAEANSPILAYINEPAFNSFVYTSPLLNRPYFPQTVGFSGQDSFAISVNGCTVTCLGGDCPEKTENSLSNCGATPPGGPIDITQTTGGVTYNTLNYDWKFWDNDWENLWTSYEGDGIYRGVVVYDDVSNQINDKHMSVLITLEDGVTSAQFSRDFTLGRCLNNGNTYYDPSLGALSTSEENNACKGGDLNSGTADDCCPSGLVCSTDGSLSRNHYCKLSDRIINRCEDFEDKDSCESNTNPAIPRASYGQNPPICTFLECFWSSNSCGVRATRYTQDPNGCVISGGGKPPNICEWTTTQTECINGRKTIHYTKVSGDTSCDRLDVEVPCGSLNFELGFFGIREFVISLLLITGIYLLFGICGKKRNEKK